MAADNTRIDGTRGRLWRRSRNVADFLQRPFRPRSPPRPAPLAPQPFPKRDFHGPNAIAAHFRPKKSCPLVSARRPLVSAQHFFVSARRPLVSARHQLVSAHRPLVSARHQRVSAQHALTSGQDRHGRRADCGDPPSANHLKGRGKIPQHIRPFVRCAGRKAAAEERHIAVVRLHLLV